MTYEFSLDNKKIILFLSCVFSLLILIFVAGWISAILMLRPLGPAAGTQTLSASRNAAVPEGSPTSTVVIKKVPPIPPSSSTEAIKPVEQKPEKAGQKDQTPSANGEKPLSSPSATGQAPNNTPAPSPVSEPQPKKKSFSVQAGAFLEKQYADDLVATLKGKGYEPYIFKASDTKGQTWHSVRIGDYEDSDKATAAAAQFKKREMKEAFVTYINSLSPVTSEKAAGAN